jgi:RNA polymerase sigma-70 factor (ECF subfamily)
MASMGSENLDIQLEDLRSGDDRAWSLLYDLLATDLLAFVRRIGARDPEDILGETMLQLVRDLKNYSGETSGLRPWAFRIARNRVIDAGRFRKRRPVEVPLEDNEPTISNPAPSSEPVDLVRLSTMFADLTTEQREVLWIRYVADFSVAETAEITGRSPEAVSSISFRAIKRLRVLLSAE